MLAILRRVSCWYKKDPASGCSARGPWLHGVRSASPRLWGFTRLHPPGVLDALLDSFAAGLDWCCTGLAGSCWFVTRARLLRELEVRKGGPGARAAGEAGKGLLELCCGVPAPQAVPAAGGM